MKSKLVRDKIPDIIRKSNKIPLTRIAELDEAKKLIIEKMHEEVEEFSTNPCLEEAGDIYHVFTTMLKIHNMTFDQVMRAAVEKAGTNGRFDNLIILDGILDENA